MPKALITGITGQDGSLLCDFLLAKGYSVIGVVHAPLDESDPKFNNVSHFIDKVPFSVVDFLNPSSMDSLIEASSPDEIYHLGAQSFVNSGFENTFDAFSGNVLPVYNLLASCKKIVPDSKFFFAGSSEMFGSNPLIKMNEDSRYLPRTMYGMSKVAGADLVRNYREQLGYKACTGILFNHESSRRGEEFVTRKITLAAARIKLGLQKELFLGSLDSKRDWSYAGDFVEAFWKMLQLEMPLDLVLGSGVAHTVRDFVALAFSELDLDYKEFVKIDEKFNRPSPFYLTADSSKANKLISWESKVSFEGLVKMMVLSDLNKCQKEIK